MKRFFAVICCLLMTGCGGSEKPAEPAKSDKKITIGVITRLKAGEVEYNDKMQKLKKSYRPSKANISANYKYFDKMNDMQLALEANQIDMFSIYQNVADYMIQRSDNKEILPCEKILRDSFCFAVRAGEHLQIWQNNT